MRFSILLHSLFAIAFLVITVRLFTGALTIDGVYQAYQRYFAGVVGKSGGSSFDVAVKADITELESSVYAGRLDAKITFRKADGAETVFDLHHPADYYFTTMGWVHSGWKIYAPIFRTILR